MANDDADGEAQRVPGADILRFRGMLDSIPAGLTAGPFVATEYPGGLSLGFAQPETAVGTPVDALEDAQAHGMWGWYTDGTSRTAHKVSPEECRAARRDGAGRFAIMALDAGRRDESAREYAAWLSADRDAWLASTRAAICAALGIPPDADYVAQGTARGDALDAALRAAYDRVATGEGAEGEGDDGDED